MKRDYKACCEGLEDIVYHVSLQHRRMQAMKDALRLKPWENHSKEKIKTLEKKIEDMTAELSQIKDELATTKDKLTERDMQLHIMTTKNADLTQMLAANITAFPVEILTPIPSEGPGGKEELIKKHDALFWYKLMKQYEKRSTQLDKEKREVEANHKRALEAIETKYKTEMEEKKQKHEAELKQKTAIITQLTNQISSRF